MPLTYRCNLNCEYCYVDKRLKRSMDLDTALSAVDFLMKRGKASGKSVDVIFVGGEPLLEWRMIVLIVHYAKRLAAGMGVSLGTIGFPTNGLLLNRKILEYCRKEGISVAVSIDGMDNKRMTVAGENSFPRVERKIPLLLEYRDVVRIRSTVHPDHVGSSAETFKQFLGLGFIKVDMQPVIGVLWKSEQMAEYLKNLEASFVEVQKNNSKSGSMVDIKHLRDFNGARQDELGCPKIKEEFLVDIDGNIYPCEFFLSMPHEQRASYAIGDIEHGVREKDSENCMSHKICDSGDGIPVLKPGCASCSQSPACSKICLGYDRIGKRFDTALAQNNWLLFRGMENVFDRYKHLSGSD